MSRNGSGTYTLPAGNPVVTGTTISSTWANSTLTNIASALTDSLAADGQTTATGNLKMGNNRITGLADGIASTDAATKSQVDTAIAGLGTMSAQNANAVAVTGGAVDGTAVGTTTRSTVKATALDLGLSTQSVAIGQGDSSSIKNRIINGAMVIDQRNAGASFSSSANNVYNLDRFYNQNNSAGTRFSVQQNAGSVTPPAGFTNYLGVTSTSAYSVVSQDVIGIGQRIEGYNIADLDWGTANAKTITISFWVRSSLTGTFGGSLTNGAPTRFYPFTYTISSANTWEQKSITITGDTTGTWLTTSDTGISLLFNLGTGSDYTGPAGAWTSATDYAPTGAVSVVGTNGATFYITGVQLEVGSQVTSFDFRAYGTELALCQRYYEVFAVGTGSPNNVLLSGVLTGSNCSSTAYFKTTKRATPSWALLSGTSWTNTPNNSMTSVDLAVFQNTTSGFFFLGGGTGQGIAFSAEL
jgi:hypothetical protein